MLSRTLVVASSSMALVFVLSGSLAAATYYVDQSHPGASDDTLHSMLYCMLTSKIQQPNPDIIAPMGVRE